VLDLEPPHIERDRRWWWQQHFPVHRSVNRD
jgi:hypothetical protein